MITSLSKSPERDDVQQFQPTVWGMSAVELHDRFWAARGVQVVRQGRVTELVQHADLYLLIDHSSLVLFRLHHLSQTLDWMKSKFLFARVHAADDPGYKERVVADADGRFIRFERSYREIDYRLGRVALTPDREAAERWQKSNDTKVAWRELRRSIAADQRATVSVDGHVYDRDNHKHVNDFVHQLVYLWRRPDATIPRAKRLAEDVWGDCSTTGIDSSRLIGPVWIGSGRSLSGVESVVGPAVLWDDPDQRPEIDLLHWQKIKPDEYLASESEIKTSRSFYLMTKRLFDIGFALIMLLLTLPLYPLLMLAIFIEDGKPFLFAHRRESLGGREFPCLKFRTMLNDAEDIKQQLQQENQADGPQFFIQNDPRITRVGKFMRKTNLDELPQFFNVLLGQMSVIGPRPSPYKENQFSPAWREARLSVKPGITGLWQVMRSREPGKDFQEWIEYDIRYVENASWRMDLMILWRTFLMVIGRR